MKVPTVTFSRNGSVRVAGQAPADIEAAILRTVLYADVFDFPMTVEEIHHFLICDHPASLERIRITLTSSERLRQHLIFEQGYVVCAGRQRLIQIRHERERASQQLWPQAVRFGRWLARLPFVRMVALTGALAVRNAADGDDDLDYLLVTARGRVWLARAFSILLVRLGRLLYRVEICPNYILAEDALEQEWRNLFMAHEVAQMVPLYGRLVYQQMRQANAWVASDLPNAEAAFHKEDERPPGRHWDALKRLFEWLLGGRLGNALENWEYRRKLRRFAGQMHNPDSAALLDTSHVKGHFDDHGHPVLRQYDQRLREYGLEETHNSHASQPLSE